MKLWLSKSSAVPLREQLTTQVLLGILSDDLAPGEKMPSTRELARRFHLHQNTVSAAYRDLERRGWLECHKGSGVYVRTRRELPPVDPVLQLDRLIAEFYQSARGKGFRINEIQARLKQWADLQPPDHFIVIEPEVELRRILEIEIAAATGFPTTGIDPAECANNAVFEGAVPVMWFSRTDQLARLLPPRVSSILLYARSVPDVLQEKLPAARDVLVSVASHWPDFLKWARSVLVAGGIHPDALVLYDMRERRRPRKFPRDMIVITDAYTAKILPAASRLFVFHLIADPSLAELRDFVAGLS